MPASHAFCWEEDGHSGIHYRGGDVMAGLGVLKHPHFWRWWSSGYLEGRRQRVCELEQVDVRVHGQNVTRSDNVKYLGVWIDDGLTCHVHIKTCRVRRKYFVGLAKLYSLRNVLPLSTKKIQVLCMVRLLFRCFWHETSNDGYWSRFRIMVWIHSVTTSKNSKWRFEKDPENGCHWEPEERCLDWN